MKISKVCISLFLTLTISFFCFIEVFAHDAMLSVSYDNCDYNSDINKMWYALNDPDICYHIDNECDTIKYYFEDFDQNGNYNGSVNINSNTASEIKEAYANSMKKWNNIYFYTYNTTNIIVRERIVNIVEGTASDHNLSIYFVHDENNMALTYVDSTCETIETVNVYHQHYAKWKMTVAAEKYYVHGEYSEQDVSRARERVGAHEIGHVLGLQDIDNKLKNLCHANTNSYHHTDALMGYGYIGNIAVDISYKDIAGAAITRGLHTDLDHKWLNCGQQSNGKYKLVCSICNGVKEVNSLSGYTYDTYNACGGNHNLSGGNMMAVASYGSKDYYKCRYCRYVAPFSANKAQNYVKTYHNSNLHKCVNNVNGLEYEFYEQHNVVNGECTGCGEHIHSHTSSYLWISEGKHKSFCECGAYIEASHVIRQNSVSQDGYGICMLCRGRAFMGVVWGMSSSMLHSENGSYILPNGVIVLVDEDIESYFNGTLEFYSDEE